ncbi:hypothetical protein OSB04_009166 [Centaurea solstitialis]|uniref:RING-type E3 ubiquitin transferase n=1 Tax=Centaurea solstitialis TaxID=347529 RepID=A0AA38WU99_9ASTR|nr:hypothetical protein OSB04_009166 [Centaurea solstitialis]
MGSLLCCFRGSAADGEDGDSNENEQTRQESNNTTSRSATQGGFIVFPEEFTKKYNGLLARGGTGPLQSSSSTSDGKGSKYPNGESELVCGSSGYEDCASSEDDECIICLEEYTCENPRITTKCSHHSHLSCILEWQQRSELCPVCATLTEFEEMS